jgi:hypothetical protein
MADNYKVLDGVRALLTLAAKEIGGVLFPKHIIVGPDGVEQNLLAALQKLAPATDLIPITPSDTTLTGVRSLYVGTGGDLVVTINGHDRTLENVPDGFILSAQVTKVKAATTASGIIAYV